MSELPDGSAPTAGKFRAVYGRGFFDGLRLAGVENPKEFMNAARLASLENALSGIARKVYEAVPMQEAWTATSIFRELQRMNVPCDTKMVNGCLNSLVERCMVKEPRKGEFVRAHKQKLEAVVNNPPVKTQTKPEVEVLSPSKTPIESLSQLAVTVRALSDKALDVADAIEEAALTVDDAIHKNSADIAKARQLQELLKSFGGGA